jgi:4-hydroxybenzoate polyprenyltransferase
MAAQGSSSTSSPIFPSSSTSESPAPLASRLTGLVRLVHPFPSILDGIVTGSFAVVAGGTALVAAGLGLAMVALQGGIGATNDLVDAPRDAGHKPGKPIPAGLVSRAAARGVAVAAFVLGIGLAGLSGGPAEVALALVVVAIGLAYDLRLKGTAWSWLPFAVGIPVLPVFGWLGASGRLPTEFLILVPAAVAAGAALSIANALVDVERDRAAGSSSIALALGPSTAWLIHLGLLVAVGLAAAASVGPLGGSSAGGAAVAVAVVLPVGAGLAARSGGATSRERAWELEAVGVAVLALAWLLAVLS